MEKELARKFVKTAIGALAIVLVFLTLVTNTANYFISLRQLDGTLSAIAFNNNQPAGPEPTFFDPLPSSSRESTRFFAVDYDADGTILAVAIDYVSTLSEEEARSYGEEAKALNKSFGWLNTYRFYAYEHDGKISIVFLNAETQLRGLFTFLILSCLISALCLLGLLVLCVLFSRRAIAPYIQNAEAQKRFITNASHELKTPLTSIATSADILAMDNPDSEWLANIQKQTMRLNDMVNELTVQSRLDEASPRLEATDFTLSSLLKEAAASFAGQAASEGKTFTTNIEEDMVIHADADLIRQLILILLDNAFKYGDANGTVCLSGHHRKNRFVIKVKNSCSVLLTKSPERLFERFYRGDESHSSEIAGTGLGLSIARSITERHNGSIKACQNNDLSVALTVELPEK